MTDVPSKYVVMKPLSQVDPEKEEPVSVKFLVKPDKLAALTILASFDRPGLENVAVPWVAACQVVGVMSYPGGGQSPLPHRPHRHLRPQVPKGTKRQ